MRVKANFADSAVLERPEREDEARNQEIKEDVVRYGFEKEFQFLMLPMCKTWYWSTAREVWVEVPEGQAPPRGTEVAYS